MLHKASSDGAVEMVRFLATECGSVDLEAKDQVTGPCVHVPNLFLCEASGGIWMEYTLTFEGFLTAR